MESSNVWVKLSEMVCTQAMGIERGGEWREAQELTISLIGNSVLTDAL
jgi:hypothetical protein